MRSDTRHLVIRGCEITLNFNHTREPNQIVSTVEQMLLNIGLPVLALPVTEPSDWQEETAGQEK